MKSIFVLTAPFIPEGSVRFARGRSSDSFLEISAFPLITVAHGNLLWNLQHRVVLRNFTVFPFHLPWADTFCRHKDRGVILIIVYSYTQVMRRTIPKLMIFLFEAHRHRFNQHSSRHPPCMARCSCRGYFASFGTFFSSRSG